jgi:hypothetical protein
MFFFEAPDRHLLDAVIQVGPAVNHERLVPLPHDLLGEHGRQVRFALFHEIAVAIGRQRGPLERSFTGQYA